MQSNLTKTEVLEGEVVDSKVQDLEPIVVHASLQFIVNSSDNVTLEVETLMQSATETIVEAINSHQHKKVIPIQRYAKTAHAARYIDVDESFLNKRKGTVFKLGKHFFKPPGQSIVRWDIEALSEWMQSEYDDSFIDEELAELLESS